MDLPRLSALPLGIALLVGVLTITGVGSVAAGVYMFLASPTISVWAAATALVAGPAVLYLVLHIVRRSAWAWRALIGTILLLLVSSVLRLVVTPGVALAPMAEILVEAAALYYLSRREIRGLFTTVPG